MKRKLLSALLAMTMVAALLVPAASAAEKADSPALTWAELEAKDAEAAAAVKELHGASGTVTLHELSDFALLYSGMEEKQLGTHPHDWDSMAKSADLLAGVEADDLSATATQADFRQVMKQSAPLYDALHAEKLQPLFINGLAQPIFPYTTGEMAEGYDNADSDIIRFFVYVETNYDTDLDGKLDMVKVLVQVPRAAYEGDYQAATIYEARPYITGGSPMYGPTEPDGTYGKPGDYDLKAMYNQPAPREPVRTATAEEVAADVDSAEWYYYDPYKNKMQYEDLTWYDYYLVRGYAMVACGGLGTRGSDGLETCGTDLEIDAFKCVIEWLHGDRVAYTDKESNIAVEADWSNGKVGMTGRSYAGTTQFGLATTGVEGLDAIVPVAGIASWYEYRFMQGVSNGGLTYSDALSTYCAGRVFDPADWESIKDRYFNYLETIRLEQVALNGDYDGKGDSHWTIRDYTLNAENIKCPALIVHGLNDENVRTKQFDLMYRAYQKAGATVKLMLHQNGHLTPTYPNDYTQIYIGDELYDAVLNKWFSHYLYNVDNGAEDMPAVMAQSNVDGSWSTYDSWEAQDSVVLAPASSAMATITSNATRGWYNDPTQFFGSNTESTVAFAMDVEQNTTIEGVVEVHFTAATQAPETNNDNLRVSAYLYDVSEEAFPVFNRKGSYLPYNVISKADEGGAWIGGGLKNYNLVEYAQTDATYKMIEYGWMDLCNPKAGYDSYTATRDNRVDVDGETYYDYTLYLQPNLYEVVAGHKLVLVLTTNTGTVAADKAYTVTIDQSKTYANIPVVCQAEKFDDVDTNEWYHNAVDFAVSNGLMAGTGSASFAPNANLSRAMIVQILWANAGKPACDAQVSFTDVKDGQWYTEAVRWAASKGIVAGYSDELFGTEDHVTREQLAAMLYKYAQVMGLGISGVKDELPFRDASSISRYAVPAVKWAYTNGIMSGKEDNRLDPAGTATRAETAQMLMKFCAVV